VTTNVIEIEGLRKEYRRLRGGRSVAVEGLDLAVPAGGVFGFLGPNGSGKTTTIRCLLGLIRPTAGDLTVLGEAVPGGLVRTMRRIGAIVETPALFPTMTARENLRLAVTGIEQRLGAVPTVFGAAALAPGRVTITPRTGLEDGQVVQVVVTALTPGARVQLAQCVPPGEPVAERCGAPGPVVPLIVGADGRASASFPVRAGSVGSGHHPCQRGRECALAVITADGAVRGPVVPITFSAGRGASYHGGQLAIGLLVAAALAAMACQLLRTTDWREPSEAATPELDAATFGDL
jgi:ABC-type Fe3+/spermidine/putrescine transport system ATPase subunit